MKNIKKTIAVTLAISMFTPSISFAGELIDTEQLPEAVSAVISYEIDKLQNTVSNLTPIFSDDAETEDEADEKEFEDPGKDLRDIDIKTLYDMGYDPNDIEKAIELSSIYDKTPYELLQMKGKKKYITAEEAAAERDKEAEEIPISDETVDISAIKTSDTTDNLNNDITDEASGIETDSLSVAELNEANVDDDMNADTAVYDLEAEENPWDSVEAELIADTNKEISENQWEAIKALGIDDYIDRSMLSEDELSELDRAGEDTANLSSVIVPPTTDMTNIYNDYIFPSGMHDQIMQGGYSGSGSVYVNDLTGNNIVEETDISLKGRNGLDLNLTRHYSVTDANDSDAIVGKTTQTVTTTTRSFYSVSGNPRITIYYREPLPNGQTQQSFTGNAVYIAPNRWNYNHTPSTATPGMFVNYEAYQEDLTRISNQQEPKYLFNNQSTANTYVNYTAAGKYNYDIYFNSGTNKIRHIEYDLTYNDFTASLVRINGVSSFTIKTNKYAYYDDTDDSTNSKYFNIGSGWSFDFPYIETRKDSSNNTTYEYLHMGSSGVWQINEDNELVDYYLNDITLSSGGSFNGTTCSYILTEKTGKKYYFGTIGQLLAIEDRYGNKIQFTYSTVQIGGKSYPRLSSITDSVGRVISLVYTGNTKVTVTVTDQNDSSQNRVIEYNKTSAGNGIYVLTSVKDAQGYITGYNYDTVSYKTSMTSKDFNSDYSTIRYSKLTSIVYPTGLHRELEYKKVIRNCGLEGVSEIPACTCVSDVTYDEDDDVEEQRNKISYGISAGTTTSQGTLEGYDGYPTFRCMSEIPDEYRVLGTKTTKLDKRMYLSRYDNSIYALSNRKNWLKESSTTCASDYTDPDPNADEEDILTEITEYTYNVKEQCTKERIRKYNDFVNDKNTYIETTTEYTYDSGGYNDITSVKRYGDTNYMTSYLYNNTYHIPTRATYKKDSSTTIVNNYTLTSDNKSIATATVTENNSTKRKRAYTYDSYGNVVTEKRYSGNNNWNDYMQINYSYLDGRNVSNKLNGVYLNQISVSGIKDADGNSLSDVSESMTYDWYGNIISETDPNGELYSYTYDKLDRITAVTNPNASTVGYTYTVSTGANEVQVIDENGNIKKYSYDKFGDESALTDITSNALLSVRARERDNDMGHLVISDTQYSTQNGYTKTKTYYNCLGQEFSKEVLDSSDNLLYSERYDYENAVSGLYDKVTKTVYGDNNDNTVNISYIDKYGNTVKEEAVYTENGTSKTAVTDYTYDFVGNVKTVREPRASAENWSSSEYSSQYEYDVAGNIIEETDVNGNSITNTYDGLGNLVSVTDKNGNTTINSYDVLGRLLKEQIPFQENGSSIIYATNKYYYDANGNITRTQKANNAAGSSETFTKTDYTYNWQGQPTKVQEYNGNSVSNCVQYYYDSVGNVLRMYTGYVNGLNINGLDNLSGTTSNYAVTKYAYDSMNRCITETDALGQITSNVYDINGSLLQTTDRNGNILSYSYDGLNRLTQKSSSRSADDTYTYSYDSRGMRTVMTGGGTDASYEYDGLGRLTKETLTNGSVKEYTYDMNGNRKSFKLTKDNTVQYLLTYSYDKMNRLIGMFEDGSLKIQYAYNADGTLRRSLSGTRITDYTYNLANMVTEVNNRKSTTQISDYTYTYYVDGNQKSKSESVAGVDKGTTNYTYDGLGRLKKEELPETTKVYSYDYYGNRNYMSADGEGSTNYLYDKNNRLTKRTNSHNGISYITEYWYDPNGNQISSMSVDTSLKDETTKVAPELAGQSSNSINEYNSWNQLIYTAQNGKTSSYAYNGDGLRMSKTVNGTTTSHLWDGTNIAADVTGANVTKYIRGLNLISSETGNNESFYNYNAHGDVVQLTGSNGSITKQYSYDAFGVELDIDANDTNPFRYCGEYCDKESGNIYLRARYYDPATGRFISEDPIKDGLNWYSYCRNDGINNTDSSGLKMNGKRTSYELGHINGQLMKVIANKAAHKKAEITGGSETYLGNLSSWANEERTELLDYMNDEFKGEGLAQLFNEQLEDGMYTTIEATSALLCVVAYYRAELDKNEIDRDLSYDKLSSVFRSAKKDNVLYYVDITATVEVNQVLDDYFYPLKSSLGISGNRKAYDSKNGKTIYARTAYPVDDQDSYQYAPDSL